MSELRQFFRGYGFLLALGLVMMAAVLVPQPGAPGGVFGGENNAQWAAVLIFLFTGLTLPTEQIRSGLKNWRLHGFIQWGIFILSPAWAWGLVQVFAFPEPLVLGILFVSILPCTVSTTVIYSTAAGGSTVAALFNTTLANLAGVFLVPVAAGFFLGLEQKAAVPVSAMLTATVLNILLPLVVGQLIRPWVRSLVERSRRWISRINNGLILFIAYLTFAHSTIEGIWERSAVFDLVKLGGFAVVFTLGLLGVVVLLLRWFRFSRSEMVTAIMCIGIKTLAAGVPLTQAIFGRTSVDVAMILLPLTIIYATQMLLCGALVEPLRKGRGKFFLNCEK